MLSLAKYSLALALAASVVPQAAAQRLNDLRFRYPDIPYMVDTNNGPRGIQTGYNLCNATTEGPESRCQTTFVNTIEDFCLWAPPELGVVGDTEGEMVAWCTRPGRGTRLIPEGALKGVQFMKTDNYIQITGFVDQVQINIESGDQGGEMDPHGADNRGNPLGGIMFSNAFGPLNATGTAPGTEFKQVIEWTNFMGADRFCMKVCDPAYPEAARMCEHIYDRIGCAYNAPAAYVEGTFETCLGDEQLFPGVYVGNNGVTSTYTQPEGLITTIPYVAFIPASSQCTQFASAELYGPGVGGTPIVSPTTATTATASDVVTIQTSTGSAAATSTGATTTTGGSTGPLPTIGGTATTRSTGTAASTGAQSTTSTGAGAKLQVGGLLAGLMGLIVVV